MEELKEQKLICNSCGLEVHLPARENTICGQRLYDGKYCAGTIKLVELMIPIEEVLTCSICERTADNLSLKGVVCDFRLPSGRLCQGILQNE